MMPLAHRHVLRQDVAPPVGFFCAPPSHALVRCLTLRVLIAFQIERSISRGKDDPIPLAPLHIRSEGVQTNQKGGAASETHGVKDWQVGDGECHPAGAREPFDIREEDLGVDLRDGDGRAARSSDGALALAHRRVPTAQAERGERRPVGHGARGAEVDDGIDEGRGGRRCEGL
jgi:hypothetical protein